MSVMNFKMVIFFASITTFLFSCANNIDIDYIKSKIWEHDSGFSVGEVDFMTFKNDQILFQLRGDTIYYSGNPKALIKSLDKKYFNLTVTSMDGKESGIYRNQEESLHSQ